MSYIIGDLNIQIYSMPGIGSNMYVIIENSEALIIDPHINSDVFAYLKDLSVNKVCVLLTHEHFDHISGVNFLRENFECHVICSINASDNLKDSSKNLAKFWDVIMMDKSDEEQQLGLKFKDEGYVCWADSTFDKNEIMKWNGHIIKMFSAPGHSKGGAVYIVDNVVFSGDNLVNGAGVICRLPGGNWKTFVKDTIPLFDLMADGTWIFPGHGTPDKFVNLRKFLNKFGTV